MRDEWERERSTWRLRKRTIYRIANEATIGKRKIG